MVVFGTEYGECEVRISKIDQGKGTYLDEYVKLDETSLNNREKVHDLECDRYLDADDGVTYGIEAIIRKGFKFRNFDAVLADVIDPELGTVASITIIDGRHSRDGVEEDVTRLMDKEFTNHKLSVQDAELFLQSGDDTVRSGTSSATFLKDFIVRIRKVKWDDPPTKYRAHDFLAYFGKVDSLENSLHSAAALATSVPADSKNEARPQISKECNVAQVKFHYLHLEHLKVAGIVNSPPPYYMFSYEGLSELERGYAWRELQELHKKYVRQELVKRNKPGEMQKYCGSKPISKEQPYYWSTWKALTKVRKDNLFPKLLSAIRSYENGDRLPPFHNQVFEVISLYEDDQQNSVTSTAKQYTNLGQHQCVQGNVLDAGGQAQSDTPLASNSIPQMSIKQEFSSKIIAHASKITKSNEFNFPKISKTDKRVVIDLSLDSDDEEIESLKQQIETQKTLARLQAQYDEVKNRKRVKREVKAETE